MARIFRYRYVDFGTSFVGDPGTRGPQSGKELPGTLFANELATDVGGTCWGANEPLPIIDHHFQREAQFPSASGAVLHKASEIRLRFANTELVWLVTHKEPDFDAFGSMYLARWLIENADVAVDWRRYGLHPDSWMDTAEHDKIDWFSVDWAALPPERRWAAVLASYACLLEGRRRISCPARSALHSVLYAALKRGRDYLGESSGATEFFDEVRSVLIERQLNPIFDSVLEGRALFAPELRMLEVEAEAYQRDMKRARRSRVYLPESEAPSPDFFKSQDHAHPIQRRSSDLDAAHLLLADTFRIPTDGIYLRDPECVLFKEWARLDLDNSYLGAGFEFTAIAHSRGRPEAVSNNTDYQFSIDPERANGRHLYTVWSRLQTQEVEALRRHDQEIVAIGAPARGSVSTGGTTLGSLLADPWVGGQSRFGNAVGAPQRGTLIGPAGSRSDLRDDPVAEAVRTELETSIYCAASLVTGPQVAVFDLAASREGVDIAPQRYDLNSALEIPAPPETYFRFASIDLRSDVGINAPNLGLQIAEDLWQVLYPETPGVIPADFRESHVVVEADYVGVWGERGIAIAQRQHVGSQERTSRMRSDFGAIVSILRDVDRLTEQSARTPSQPAAKRYDVESFKSIISSAEELARRFAQIRHTSTLPDHDLLLRFCDSVNISELAATVRDISACYSESLRQRDLASETQHMESRTDAIAQMQSRLEWVKVLVIGFIALAVVDVITQNLSLNKVIRDALLALGGPLVLGLTAWLLKPWQRKKDPQLTGASHQVSWLVVAGAVAFVIAWFAVLDHLWTK